MTHNNHENLTMMDPVTSKYGKTTFITVSKALAIGLVVVFFVCIVATGLLVYSFTSVCPRTTTNTTNTSTLNICDRTVIISSRIKSGQERTSEEISTSATTTSTSGVPKTSIAAHGQSKPKIFKDLNIRLPKHLLPHSYQIHLMPFLNENNFTFHGEETILLNVTNATNNIVLHSVDLTIDSVNVMNVRNESISVTDVRLNKDKQFMIVDLDSMIEGGQQYYLYIKFKGVLNNMLEGFYRSSYVENNVTKWIAATQFQATDARKAFPCFDEPALKAKFQINIARMKNMTSISNMPKIDTTDDVKDLPDYVWDHFEESLPMSTYLVAFVVSDFQNITKGNFSVWARPTALHQARFALEIGPIILKYYEKFFGVEYPLPKVDMVAIPDFYAGAMENWGLITYREPALLYEKGVSSKVSRQRIAHVVAHELAHQWFGNLVTPVWWDDLWLNEGFATYVEYLGAHAVNPKWKDLDLFLILELQQSFMLDALKSSHPISCKVNDPDEVDDLFDRISYSKGASIIRMMKEFLGEKVFQSGLNKYLRSRMYKNAEQNDLWQTLTEQTLENETLPDNVTIKAIMDTWTLQTGFPVISVKRQENGNLVICQERYLLESDSLKTDLTTWWVPITIIDNTDRVENTWLKKERQIIMHNALVSETQWYIVNVLQNGYYRVNYDEGNWKSLISQLQNNGHIYIHLRNRAQMIDDAMNLAFAGYLDYDIALNVTMYLKNEREYVPWKSALNNFKFLYNMLIRSAHFDKFKTYVLSLLKEFYMELSFREMQNEEPLKVWNRMEIVDYACKLGLKDCVLQAVQQFQNWRNSADPDKENVINPDLRHVVYCTAIADGGQEEWDFAWERYLNTNVASHKVILLSALGCSKDVWILSRFLEWSITENSGIRKHDADRVFESVSENPVGQDLVYRFLKTNWQRIKKYFGEGSIIVSSLVRSTVEKFNTQEEVDDFKLFFERKRNEFGSSLRTAQQSIEQAEANTRWMNKYFTTIREWFETVEIR